MKKFICLLFAFFVVASCAIAGGVVLSGCGKSGNPSLSQDYDDGQNTTSGEDGDKISADASYHNFYVINMLWTSSTSYSVSAASTAYDAAGNAGHFNFWLYADNGTVDSVDNDIGGITYYAAYGMTADVGTGITNLKFIHYTYSHSNYNYYRYALVDTSSHTGRTLFGIYASCDANSYKGGITVQPGNDQMRTVATSSRYYLYTTTASNYDNGNVTTDVATAKSKSTTRLYGSYYVIYRNTYYATYDANGGSGAPSDQTFYAGVGYTLTTTKPTRTGYTFNGWWTSATGGTKYTSRSDADCSGNHTYYAHWTTNTYTVSYSAGGGSGTKSNSTWYYDSNYSVSNTFSRTGYSFSGWSISGCDTNTHYYGTSSSSYSTVSSSSFTYNCTGVSYYKNLRATAGTVTFTAQWTLNYYNVTVVAGDGIRAVRLNNKSGSDLKQDSESYTAGSLVTLRAQVSDGYEFAGWTVTSGSVTITRSDKQLAYFNMPESNVTIKANTTGKYLPLSINTNGGTMSPISYNAYNYYENDDVTGDFVYNAQGYYESTNMSIHNSTAMAIISFSVPSAQYVYIRAICYAEDECDEGVFSNLDKDFSGGVWWNVIDYDDEEECEYSSPWEMVRSVYCSAGSHYFYVKYQKDSSVNRYYDSLQFKIDNVSSYTVENVYSNKESDDEWIQVTPFKMTSDGYYTSTNKDIDTSLSYMRYYFTTTAANQTVSFSCISYGESNYDYGIMSNLDTYLTLRNTLDSSGVYKSFRGQSSPSAVTVSYTVPVAGSHFIAVKYIKDGSASEYDDQFKIKFTTGYTKVVQVGGTYGTLPTVTRSNYTLKNWNNGSVTATSTVAGTSNNYISLTAYWTANSITNTVKLRVINKDGTYSNVDSNLGGTVTISRAVINSSQNGSSRSSTTQTVASNTYAVHQGQSFSFTGTAKDGYIFAGVSTSSTPTDGIKNPTTPITTAISYTPTSGTTYYVYFKQVSDNQLKYDSEGKYYYFEDGYYPQSEVDSTLVSTLNSSATTNGESFTYNDGTENIEVPVYEYDGDRFVKLTASGETKWFKFEPIRWRVTDVGVNNTNADRPDRLKTYSSYKTNFTAVSDLILGFGAMHSTRAVGEGTVATDLDGFVQVQGATDNCTFNFNYAKSQTTIDIQRYTTVGSSTVIDSTNENYSSPLRIVSTAELDEVGLTNRQAKASALVAFVLGLDEDRVTYWTRDLSNLGAGVAISQSGTTLRPWLDKMYGLRFAYTFTEGSNIAYYS